MLFAKENYFNQVQSLQGILQSFYNQHQNAGGLKNIPAVQQAEESEDSPFLTLMIQQDKKFWQ
jgi:hypothetical protein